MQRIYEPIPLRLKLYGRNASSVLEIWWEDHLPRKARFLLEFPLAIPNAPSRVATGPLARTRRIKFRATLEIGVASCNGPRLGRIETYYCMAVLPPASSLATKGNHLPWWVQESFRCNTTVTQTAYCLSVYTKPLWPTIQSGPDAEYELRRHTKCRGSRSCPASSSSASGTHFSRCLFCLAIRVGIEPGHLAGTCGHRSSHRHTCRMDHRSDLACLPRHPRGSSPDRTHGTLKCPEWL